METIQESVPDKSVPAAVPAGLPTSLSSAPLVPAAISAAPRPSRLSLPPKGACWYCDKPLDSVKRFCGKTCSDAFDEEAEYTR